jgi:serine-type D-Ala-D-Ala carboxypeptidase (penicillin-binding protein 5/6)
MNVFAEKMEMQNTHFDSPHGLCNIHNVSTAHDMAILTNKCMYIDQFRQIVKTKYFEVTTEMKTYEWQSTNKLLGCKFNDDETPVPVFKGTLGCKTGITNSAGPCFAGAFSRAANYEMTGKDGQLTTTRLGDNCIVIVLNCKSMEQRWVEVPKMVQWY